MASSNMPLRDVFAQEALSLPPAGTRVELSPNFTPPLLKGIKVYSNDPFRLNFILDKGETTEPDTELTTESNRLIKYFLAALTIPEQDIWVNLSPYEQDRIVPEGFGQTEMGRDLLAQDYILKQITASVIYPEKSVGKKFWDAVYAETMKRYGTTDVPMDTFNKVWILPDKATIYETADAAFVVESRLKVMLEEDYLALEHSVTKTNPSAPATNKLGSDIVREIVLPILEKEVNEGKNFTPLRQVYHSLILATWYKRKIKDSIISQAYVAQDKTAGIDIEDKEEKEKIWQQYVEAFKKGAYNLIKEEYDPTTQEIIPRKYFSGGFIGNDAAMNSVLNFTDIRPTTTAMKGPAMVIDTRLAPFDAAMSNRNNKGPLATEAVRPEVNRLISTTSRPKQLRYSRLTTENGPAISDWILTPSQLLPEAPLLKQLIYNIYFQSTSGDKKVADGWISLLAQKWDLNVDVLNRLMAWFRQNQTLDIEVSENNLYEFMKAIISSYQQFPDLRPSFIYYLPPKLSGDAQLVLATTNTNRMIAMAPPSFVGTKETRYVLKAPIEGTPYFIGIQYGLAESTHGLYVALGKERGGQDPLNGTFFRIGLDTQGDSLRVVMMQGLAGAEKEINQTFPDTVGLHPGVAMLYIAAALAEQGHLQYDASGPNDQFQKKFERLSGIRPEFIPTIKHGNPSIGMVEKAALEKASPTHGAAIFEQLKKEQLMNGSDSQGYIRANVRVITAWLQKNFPEDSKAILNVMQPDPVQMMISYARFGLRKSTEFDRWQETTYLTQELIPERIKRGDAKANAIVALNDTFKKLRPVTIRYPIQDEGLPENRANNGSADDQWDKPGPSTDVAMKSPITSKQTVEGRNTDVTALITSPLFAAKTGLDVRQGPLRIVDIGVGNPPLTAIETQRALGTLNPEIKFIGTELPQATPRAQVVVRQGPLLEAMNKIITAYMGNDADFLNSKISEVSFVLTDSGEARYGNVSEIEVKFETALNPGIQYYMPIAFAPNLRGLAPAKQNTPLFMSLLETLGTNRLANMLQQLNEQKTETMNFSLKPAVDQVFFAPEPEGTAGQIAVAKNPVRRALEQKGIEFVETEHLLQANITNANIITVNHVLSYLAEGPRNRFFRIAERALADTGVLIVKNADMQDETNIRSFVSKIDVYQKRNGTLTYVGSALSDVFTKEFFGNERFQAYGQAKGLQNLFAPTENPAATRLQPLFTADAERPVDMSQTPKNHLQNVRVSFRGEVPNFYKAAIEIAFEDTPIVMNTLKNLLPPGEAARAKIARVQVSQEYFTSWGDNKRVYKAGVTLQDGREVSFIVKLPAADADVGLQSLWAEWQWRRRINELAPANTFFPREGDMQDITVVNQTRGVAHHLTLYTEEFLNGPAFDALADKTLSPEEARQAARTFIEWYVNLWLLTDGYLMPSERDKRNVMFEQGPNGKINFGSMKSFDTGIFYEEMTFPQLLEFIRQEFQSPAWKNVAEEELQKALKAHDIDTAAGLQRASSRYPRMRLNTYDENGQPTGKTATYKEIHEQKLFHEVIWIVVLDQKGNLVLQHRPFGKQDHPGLWDVYGGHPESGASTLEAADRLIKTETGIQSPVKFVPLTKERAIKRTVTHKGFTENVFVTVLAAQLTAAQVNELRPTSEALSFTAVPIQDLPQKIQDLPPSDNIKYLLSEKTLLRQAEAIKDHATAPGGIDFNPERINLTTQTAGESVTFRFDPAQFSLVQQAAGLTPVIVNILPLESLSQFFGPVK